jgi:hypothetical protein
MEVVEVKVAAGGMEEEAMIMGMGVEEARKRIPLMNAIDFFLVLESRRTIVKPIHFYI